MDAHQKRLQYIITFWLLLANTGDEEVVCCKEIPVSQCSVSLAKSSEPKNVFVEFTSRKIVTKRLKGPIPGENKAHDLFIEMAPAYLPAVTSTDTMSTSLFLFFLPV
jgi:hypothetical protein